MAEFQNLKSENIKNDDNVIHEQTNPSFHGTPEDVKNYKSLQNKSPVLNKKSTFPFKPSLLTQKVEQIRTDKAAVSATSNSSTNKFLVLGDNAKDLSTMQNPDKQSESKNVNESSGFVFGEDIFSRVIKHESLKACEESSNKQQFKDLVCNENDKSEISTVDSVDNEALRKNADELSQRNLVQQYDETEVITGEEEEIIVLKTLCKLFLFNSEKNEWIEKGYCNVHLNDIVNESENIKSRLVARSKGGLKVLLNTFIWTEMELVKASTKAVRITAQSDDGVKSFLLQMTNTNDRDSIFQALTVRKARKYKYTEINKEKSFCRKRDFFESNDNEKADHSVKKRVIENDDVNREDQNETSDV